MSDGWSPGPKYELYLAAIDDLLGGEQRTVRDVYYALESRGFPEICAENGYEFAYKYVKRAVKKGRRHGYIDPDLIYDASRPPEATEDEGNSDPVTFLSRHVDGVWTAYEENFWDDQAHHVEVWLEKQSLATVFRPICDEYNVRLEATRGDWSDSKVHEATTRLLDRLKDGDDVRILYFGDFNPSGLHAPVAVQQTMSYYGLEFRDPDPETKANYFEIWPPDGPIDGSGDLAGSLQFERVALNLEHIERYDLPENPTPSSTDKDRQIRERFMRQVSDGHDVNIELNALKEFHRDDLEQELRDAIEQYIDDETREETENRIEERQQALSQSIDVDYGPVEGV